jgi:hypothetical protein
MSTKIWENEKGERFHEDCFEKEESKEGYNLVDPTEVEDDDSCGSCGGFLINVPDPDDQEEEQAP